MQPLLRIIFLLTFIPNLLSAQANGTCIELGHIIRFNPDKCYGCWGWTIALENDTIMTDDLNASVFGYDFKQPMAIRLTIGNQNEKSKYYEILCARKEEL